MKLVITIPVYITKPLHYEFTEKTVKSIQTVHDCKTYIVQNFCVPEFSSKLQKLVGSPYVIINMKGNSVSAAWNIGLNIGLSTGADYILVPNNDLIFHPKCIDNLVDFAKAHKEYILWTAAEHNDLRTIKTVKSGTSFDEHPHFSCFMVSPKTIKLLKKKEEKTEEPTPGFFDEGFAPAYFEDGDMHNRILRAGYKAAKTASALYYHFGSRTIKVDEELNVQNQKTYEVSRQYFIKKWGWDPHGKVVPNNDPVRFKHKGPFLTNSRLHR